MDILSYTHAICPFTKKLIESGAEMTQVLASSVNYEM